MIVVFDLAAIGAKPDMREIGQFRFRVNFDPPRINGLFKALDVFSCIAVNANDVYEGEAKRGGPARWPQDSPKCIKDFVDVESLRIEAAGFEPAF